MGLPSASTLPNAVSRRCRSSEIVSSGPHTSATRTVLPTAANAAHGIGGIFQIVSWPSRQKIRRDDRK
jgi:hypothetical protein